MLLIVFIIILNYIKVRTTNKPPIAQHQLIMANNTLTEADRLAKQQMEYETICNTKDENPNNLNEIFERHGCHTLESNAPLVDQESVERMKEIDPEQQKYGLMVYKSQAANRAVENRPSRTRNRNLEMLEINGQTIISAGQERDRSPVDKDLLEVELEDYMAETKRIRALVGQKTFFPDLDDGPTGSSTANNGFSALKTVTNIGKNNIVGGAIVRNENKPRLTSNPFKNFANPKTQDYSNPSTRVEVPSKVGRVTNNGIRRANCLQRAKSLIAKSTASPVPSCKDLDDDLDAYVTAGKKLKEKDQTLIQSEDQRQMMEEYELQWS